MGLSDNFSNAAPGLRVVDSPGGYTVAADLVATANFDSPDILASWVANIDGALATGQMVLLADQSNPAENGVWNAAEPELYFAGEVGDAVRVTGDGLNYPDAIFVKQADGTWKNSGASGRLNPTSPTAKTPALSTVFDNTAPTAKTP